MALDVSVLFQLALLYGSLYDLVMGSRLCRHHSPFCLTYFILFFSSILKLHFAPGLYSTAVFCEKLNGSLWEP